MVAAACGGGSGESDRWSVVLSDLPGGLTSVWGTGPDDIWAVGGDPGDGSGSTVMRFDGAQWSSLDTGTSGDLWWVYGFQDGPVFMGGKNGLILRYEDGAFGTMDTPGTATVYGIWGASADDMWAVGGNVISGAFAWRLDGGSWREAEGFPADLAGSESLFKVWGSAPDDVWLVGTNGVALHFDGTGLSQASSGTTGHLITVHSSQGRSVAVGGLGAGVIVENDGSGWTDASPSKAPQVMGAWLDEDSGYVAGVKGAVLRLDGDEWKKVDTGIDLEQALHAVWTDPDGGVWIAGGQVLAPPLTDGVLIYRSPVEAGGEE